MVIASGNKQNQDINQFLPCYLALLSLTVKTSQSTQYLHSLIAQIWDAIVYPFEVPRFSDKVII